MRPASTKPAAAQKSFDGLRFTDLNRTPKFANLNLDTVAADYAASSAARISRQGNSPFINLSDLPCKAGQVVVISTVPESETYALLSAGLGVMGAIVSRPRVEEGPNTNTFSFKIRAIHSDVCREYGTVGRSARCNRELLVALVRTAGAVA